MDTNTSASDPGRLSPRLLRDPDVLLATGFGSGFLPVAPGTWGSLLGLALWWWLADLPVYGQLLLIAGLFLLGAWRVHRVCQRYRVGDAGSIVIDEIVGVWLALLAAPQQPLVFAAGFLLFRWFDIVKPGPVGWAERRIGGGLGVMADDLVAGGLAAGVLQLSLWSGPDLIAAFSS